MACSCGCNPCSCSPAPVTCCTPTVESSEYQFENANLVGIGFFDNVTDRLVQLRGAVSLSAALTIALNATDNTLEFDFDDALLVADIPDADTTTRGILETATNAEALAKAATDKILTPSNLAALGSTTTFAGLAEFATSAETIAGVSSTLAVTPAGLLAAASLYSTVTWADAVTRAGATPAFAGQFGTQLDTDVPWISRSAVAGGFDTPIIVGRGTNTLAANTTIADGGFGFIISGTGGMSITTSGGFEVTTNTLLSGPSVLSGATVTIGNASGEFLNFDGCALQVSGVTMGDGLLGADAVGLATEYAIASFLSSYNPQTGYTAFANGAVLRTCDTTTVTLPQLAQIVGTLIEDLKALQLPAT